MRSSSRDKAAPALRRLLSARSPLQTIPADGDAHRVRDGDVRQPDRLGRAPAVGAGDPGHGDREVRARSLATAGRHGHRDLCRDGAVSREDLVRAPRPTAA